MFVMAAATALCLGQTAPADETNAPAKAPESMPKTLLVPETAPASEPAVATSMPASRPVSVLATVGDFEIKTDRIDKLLAKLPPNITPAQRAGVENDIVNGLIYQRLLHNYLLALKIDCPDADVKVEKDKLAKDAAEQKMSVEELMSSEGLTDDIITDFVRFNRFRTQVTEPAKVDEFIKAHPNYFDGSTLTVSHIQVTVPIITSTETIKAAKEKIEKIAGEIKDGKIKFEDAAKQYSDCPSKDKGGDLGDVTFDAMVSRAPIFAMTAFDLKEGQVSEPIRTSFGYHLIKVTKRTPAPASTQPATAAATTQSQPTTSASSGPTTEPNPEEAAQDLMKHDMASRAILALHESKMLDQALKDFPVVIKK